MIKQVRSNNIFPKSPEPSKNESAKESMNFLLHDAKINTEIPLDLNEQKSILKLKEKKFAFLFNDHKLSKWITTSNVLIDTLRKEVGDEILNFLSSHFPLSNPEQILFTSKSKKLLGQVDYNDIQAIVNLQQVNTHKDINQWFCSINKLLANQGVYAGCVETYDNRMQKRERRFGKTIAKVVWVIDFIFNRVLPRLKLTKGLYYFLTRSKYRAISLAETLGRLVYCGFDIIEYKEINELVYFVVRKNGEPKKCSNVSNGLIFPMNRIGRHGKMIKVYKLRTMHPYSEFLQDFIIKRNGYNHLGKPANDFRVTGWGKIFRKLWLDEIPQIINVIKGDLSIVGVRPLSQVRFSHFPDDLKKERIKYKPGCIPPYVALCMPDSQGNIVAERIYFRDMQRNPYFTNIRYFFMAVFNIVTNKIRSA